ncbi:MAG: ATP-binding protein, partial [Microbacteriaceae bacterium]|nr:ATP-binding protein [Microbacteriaceae bacterium]
MQPGRASLGVGQLTFAPGVPLALDAGAFDRHTFLCGQSGSGKTYALGTILERLLLETSLRIIVLDPNSDFVRLAEIREDIPDDVREGYGAASSSVTVLRGDAEGGGRLHVRFVDLAADEQAAVLRLDPVADRDEYAALAETVERASELLAGAASVKEVVDRIWAHPDPLHSLAVRARNLRIDRWQIWSAGDPGSLEDLVQPGGPRCIVADLGSLETLEEQAVAAETTLAALWRRRTAREPILIVMDEAHNICPADPDSRLTAMATEHAVRIAGEGRKFGLVLLASTQRPQKVHENVISQCDNLVLMRMNSRSDLGLLSEIFSFVPSPLLRLATDFRQGEAVVAGQLVSHPTLGRFGPRWSAEGGADVPSD